MQRHSGTAHCAVRILHRRRTGDFGRTGGRAVRRLRGRHAHHVPLVVPRPRAVLADGHQHVAHQQPHVVAVHRFDRGRSRRKLHVHGPKLGRPGQLHGRFTRPRSSTFCFRLHFPPQRSCPLPSCSLPFFGRRSTSQCHGRSALKKQQQTFLMAQLTDKVVQFTQSVGYSRRRCDRIFFYPQ